METSIASALKSALTEIIERDHVKGVRLIFCLETNCQTVSTVGDIKASIGDVIRRCRETPEFTYTDPAGATVHAKMLFQIDPKQYFALFIETDRPEPALVDESSGEILLRLRALCFEYAIEKLKNEHALAIKAIGGLVDGFGKSTIFQNTLDFIVSLFNYSHGSIWEYHDNSDFSDPAYLTLEAAANHSIDAYSHRCLRSGRGVVWKVLERDAPKLLRIDSVSEDDLVNKELINSVYVGPLYLFRLEANGKIYAVACLNGEKRLDDTDVDALAAFEKIISLEAISRRNQLIIESLKRVSELLPRKVLTVEDVCARVAEAVRKIVSCQACSVFLLRDMRLETKLLELKAVNHEPALGPSARTEEFQQGLRNVTYHIHVKSLTGKVFNSAKAQLANEALKRSECSDAYREISDRQNDTWLGVPIPGANIECIGVIRCTGRQTTVNGKILPHIFDADDSTVLRSFAAAVGPIIETVYGLGLLREWNERLAIAEKIREHEMLGPLSSIAANADFVKEHIDDSGYNRELRLSNIVADSRMCSFFVTRSMVGRKDEYERNRRYVSLNAIFSRLRDFLTRMIYIRSNMKIVRSDYAKELRYLVTPFMRVRLSGTAPNTVAHEMLLQRAFFNIAGNAIKYGRPPNGLLTIRLGEDYSSQWKRHVVIDFEDNGIGIDENEREHLFEEGFRGRNVRGTRYPGSGLGLHIAKQIIELHGGQLTLSECRNPTLFRVILPVIARSESELNNEDRSNVIRNDKPKKVAL